MTDERAEYLVEHYADLILRTGKTWLGDMDDAKDICQTVLIKLLENPREFPDPVQERAWVIRVAVNECKNWRKTAWFRRRVPLDESLQLAAEDPEPEDGGLLAQVQALPAMYREVIFLRYYEGYEVKEIAALLGRSPALVSTHLKRGKEKLRNMLGGTEYARGF
ncbi:MAG: sigma-70 family RNA polymerase sigma factor [Oscillospiraceae bacterium]|jgi:RNA polymerase sigma factor (sigma-70 family)|nr:sigma-70 family RNA polymerase sigma factor [Oscillospiraceae bacterium]MCI8942546.1 sigma-70 family RNA polymerase sigma factor [Oscillospiraceae bacterium]